MYKKGRVNSNSRIISTDEDPSLRIESSAIINLRGVSTKLNKYKCNIIITRRFIAYEPAKWEINAVPVAVSSSCSIAYIFTYISLISWLKLALLRYRYFQILSDIL